MHDPQNNGGFHTKQDKEVHRLSEEPLERRGDGVLTTCMEQMKRQADWESFYWKWDTLACVIYTLKYLDQLLQVCGTYQENNALRRTLVWLKVYKLVSTGQDTVE